MGKHGKVDIQVSTVILRCSAAHSYNAYPRILALFADQKWHIP